MSRRTLKLTIAYDGSAYAGWQRQANAQSIQAVIEDEITAIDLVLEGEGEEMASETRDASITASQTSDA